KGAQAGNWPWSSALGRIELYIHFRIAIKQADLCFIGSRVRLVRGWLYFKPCAHEECVPNIGRPSQNLFPFLLRYQTKRRLFVRILLFESGAKTSSMMVSR